MAKRDLGGAGSAPDATWENYVPRSGFGRVLGPMERTNGAGPARYRVRVAAHHCNEGGFLHGGAIAAWADEVVGTMVKERHGLDHVTVQLATAFLAVVEVGSYVEPTCEIVRATRSLIFAESKLLVEGSPVASASLIFKLRPAAPHG